jgi:hypothetical protein
MKPQDILFFILFVVFFLWRKSMKLTTIAGLLCLFFAIPLFATWTFFTAQRLTWYAAGFFLLSIVKQMFQKNYENRY